MFNYLVEFFHDGTSLRTLYTILLSCGLLGNEFIARKHRAVSMLKKSERDEEEEEERDRKRNQERNCLRSALHKV